MSSSFIVNYCTLTRQNCCDTSNVLTLTYFYLTHCSNLLPHKHAVCGFVGHRQSIAVPVDKAILQAIWSDNVADLKRDLGTLPDVNSIREYKMTPLHMCQFSWTAKRG